MTGVRCAVLALTFLAPSSVAHAQTWENETPLATHVGNNPGHQFGWIGVRAGDIDDDGVQDYLITAPFLGAGSKGRVNLYSGATGVKIRGVTGKINETLGWSGSAAGELDGDSFDEYMAGAPGSGAGAAYVWAGVDGSELFALGGESAGDQFGSSVTYVGDVDGDTVGDVAVGAPGNDAAGANAGRAYIHSGASGLRIRTFDGRAAGEQFGGAVAGVGDRNGDTVPDLLVGGQTGGPSGTGIAYVVSGVDGTTIWTLSGDATSANFGQFFLGPCGDVNADQTEDLFVSDFNNSAKGPGTGRAFLFDGTDGSLLYTITGEGAGDGFAIGRGWAGDLNGDGHDDLVFGHWTNNQGGSGAGRCSVFSGVDGARLMTWTGDEAGANLGFDAAGIGDLDGDGFTDFLFTGASANQNTGVAYVISSKNPEPPLSFCTTTPNSVGAGARITYRRSTSLAANEFRLRAAGAPAGTSGLFFYGPGPSNNPFAAGTMCVQSPHYRLGPPQTTSASGAAARVLDFTQPPLAAGGSGGVLAGTTWYFQFAYRDPSGPAAGRITFTDGLTVTFQP
jgi:hypothetical protein